MALNDEDLRSLVGRLSGSGAEDEVAIRKRDPVRMRCLRCEVPANRSAQQATFSQRTPIPGVVKLIFAALWSRLNASAPFLTRA